MSSLCDRGIITPALAPMQPFSAKSIRRNKFLLGTHFLHLGRESIADKMPCLGAYAPSGIRTDDPLITCREHETLNHSAPMHNLSISKEEKTRLKKREVRRSHRKYSWCGVFYRMLLWSTYVSFDTQCRVIKHHNFIYCSLTLCWLSSQFLHN